MNVLEEEGKNVEDAVAKALTKLGAERDDVEIEVLEEGSRGVLGLVGGKPARVRVKVKESDWEKIERCLAQLLEKMGVSAHIRKHVRDDTMVFDIATSGSDGLLIGKRGQTLSALQHVMSRIAFQGGIVGRRFVIDVGSYRKRRDEMLASKAASVAERVKLSQSEIVLDPLPASDRRIIHLTLTNDPDVRTYTLGQGAYKSVVVAPVGRELPGEESEVV